MRYEDWDILLFPHDCRAPLKEFKVACQEVPDHEFSQIHGSFGVPLVTCFIPSLAAGTPFKISIHSWALPPISQFTKSYTEYPDDAHLEARLFMDGCLVASTTLPRQLSYPKVITHTFDFNKNGDLELLKFPRFRKEILQQDHWNADDAIGRIKLLISEGFPRDYITMPLERIKNVVAFAFQHAPLEILESTCIAWPNPSMWRRTFPFLMPIPCYSSTEIDAHAHSPSRGAKGNGLGNFDNSKFAARAGIHDDKATQKWVGQFPNDLVGHGLMSDAFQNITTPLQPTHNASGPSTLTQDASKARAMRKTSSDTTMLDYSSGEHSNFSLSNEPFCNPSLLHVERGAKESQPEAPSNTTMSRHGDTRDSREPVSFPLHPLGGSLPAGVSTSLAAALLRQPHPIQPKDAKLMEPATEIKSRKENRLKQRAGPVLSHEAGTAAAAHEHNEMRRVSQQMLILAGGGPPIGNTSITSRNDKLTRSKQRASSAAELGAKTANIGRPGQGLAALLSDTMERAKKTANRLSPGTETVDGEQISQGSPKDYSQPFVEDVTKEE